MEKHITTLRSLQYRPLITTFGRSYSSRPFFHIPIHCSTLPLSSPILRLYNPHRPLHFTPFPWQNKPYLSPHESLSEEMPPSGLVLLPSGLITRRRRSLSITSSPLFDAAITTIIGLSIVFVSGVAYVAWYKNRVLEKIEEAFSPGYDPVLELADHSDAKGISVSGEGQQGDYMRRPEQDLIDSIMRGHEIGHYFMLMGPKGCGKTSMMIDAMRKTHADGVAFCEAHEDIEVFRLRLGKAINFEYFEDSQTGLFQRRDPREGGPALDIERAFAKIEKVALRMSERRGKPLILYINNIHMFRNSEDSHRLLVQIQQRAESWAASGIVTVVLSTDDFWPYPALRKNATRMQIISVHDLPSREALRSLQELRNKVHSRRRALFPGTNQELEPTDILCDALKITGGRLSFIAKLARSPTGDALNEARCLVADEKAWMLSRIGLIPDCDDDVMDEQKWSSCSWLLMREFVRMRKEEEERREELLRQGMTEEELGELELPKIPYWRCRQIMTRADFLEDLDNSNLISIDIQHNVRPDSALVLQAAREVVEEEGFDEILESVRERIDEIESLHRTREVAFKDVKDGDRIKLIVDKRGKHPWW
ncbi:uncharacterized protein EI90DRAFT_3149750 [Cantharellus anzutake]|uniref:uncharacterized protein n=1 Tax=Cantharellus anzutake TaxID=1750568 RepID=UPI001902EA68|nr:uncharacterized protein EI90DRAFT_3149750 [Cantharellus anzutake]KAF8342634.1 hypothetical protein EI90DRAFT_3149750 [Cantharellus anzutake]